MAPAGGVVASANDLGRYLLMMMNGEDDVLSAEGKALMVRPANSASPFYGLGWSLTPLRARRGTPGRSPGPSPWPRWSPPRAEARSCW